MIHGWLDAAYGEVEKGGDGCENSDVHINGRVEWERHCGNATLPKPERDVEERHS